MSELSSREKTLLVERAQRGTPRRAEDVWAAATGAQMHGEPVEAGLHALPRDHRRHRSARVALALGAAAALVGLAVLVSLAAGRDDQDLAGRENEELQTGPAPTAESTPPASEHTSGATGPVASEVPEVQVCPGPPPPLPEPPSGEAINRQLLMSLFSDDLESSFGARWGGWFIDHRRDGIYVIRLVDPTPGDDEVVSGFLGEELPYVIEATPWSMGELGRQHGAVMALRENLEADGYEITSSSVGTLGGSNRVEVSLLGSSNAPDISRLSAFHQRILELDSSLDAICVKAGEREQLAPNLDERQQ